MAKTAEQRVLSLFLERKRYPADIAKRYIMYQGSQLELTDDMYDELLSIIPPVWNTEKDRLVQFVLMEDSTHFCVRNKEVYNYSRKETERKTYYFNAATDAQLSELIKLLTDFFAKKRLSEVENFYDKILTAMSDMSYMKKNILALREDSLKESDFMFNSDYTFSDSEKETQWKEYRQNWRDITATDAWTTNDLYNLALPISPQPEVSANIIAQALANQLSSISVTQQFTEDLKLSFGCSLYNEVFANFGSISFKLELLKTLSKLNIPFYEELADTAESLDSDLSQFNFLPIDVFTRYKSALEIEGEDSTTTMKEIFDEQLTNLDAKLDAINNKLQEYDVGFTISDIMTKYVEDQKAKIEDMEKEEEAQLLLNNIEGDEE